jgi:hypothetical protein
MAIVDDQSVEPKVESEIEYLRDFRLLQETHSYKGQQWFGHRQELVEEYGWAVPNEDVLEYISNAFSRITEVGAGEGYWAKLLSERGTRVEAFDPNTSQQWYEVVSHELEDIPTYVEGNPVLMVWPPANDGLAREVLEHRPSHVLYVGETRGGCTASDEFFDVLTDWYSPIEKIELPSYAGVDDNFYHLVRKV